MIVRQAQMAGLDAIYTYRGVSVQKEAVSRESPSAHIQTLSSTFWWMVRFWAIWRDLSVPGALFKDISFTGIEDYGHLDGGLSPDQLSYLKRCSGNGGRINWKL